jgi:predicted DCC family thiol-disulfide oxidoreductase YuxK
MTILQQKPRLIYDGICNLCSGAVRFLHALDRARLVEYVPYQNLDSNVQHAYGLNAELLQGRMHLIGRNGSLSSGPVAITEVCKLLTPFKFICDFFKTAQAQRLYDWIAGRRYRIFGCRDTCYVVNANRN